jgi:FkbM family methyltransferase
MRVFDSSLTFYRNTFKRVRPLHVAVHAVMSRAVIPLLERRQRFYTIVDDPFWFRLDLLTGRHESETTRQIDRLVKPGMTVLDIGAHVGYYSRRSAQLVGSGGRVFAFEPHPRTFETLVGNMRPYPNVTPVQAAVAESEGSAELYDYLMMSASGSLHYDESMRDLQKAQLTASDVAPRIATDFPVQTYSVRTLALDDYLAGEGVQRVDVVKMDIEGAEIGALRGMRGIIASSPGIALIMEYNPAALKGFNHDPQKALAEVLAMGFDTMQIIEADGSLRTLTDDDAAIGQAISQMTIRLMDHMGVVNLLLTRNP